MSERILVTGKKISSMELVTNVTGNEKIPTGQPDDLALTPNQIADHTIARGGLVSQEDLSHVESSLGTQIAAEEAARIAADSLKVDKEGSVSSVAGRVGDVVLAPSDVLVEGFGSQEDVNKYVPKPFLSGYTYGLGERVILNNGEVVKSLVDENVGNPNVDMTGWVSTISDSLSDTIQTFNTPEAGVDPVTGVQNGVYYNVRSTDDGNFLVEYQNIGGVPTPTGQSYPPSSYVQEIAAQLGDLEKSVDFTVSSVAELRTKVGELGQVARTLAYYDDVEGGGAAYKWVGGTEDNGFNKINGWELIFTGEVDVRCGGAKVNLPVIANQTAVISTVTQQVNALGGGIVHFPAGTFYASVRAQSNVEIRGKINIDMTPATKIQAFAAVVGNDGANILADKPFFKAKNFELDGSFNGAAGGISGLRVTSYQCEFENIVSHSSRYDAGQLSGNNANFNTFKNCVFKYCKRNVFSWSAGHDNTFEDCQFIEDFNVWGVSLYLFDIEPNDANGVWYNATFKNCTFDRVTQTPNGAVLIDQKEANQVRRHNVTFDGCKFKNFAYISPRGDYSLKGFNVINCEFDSLAFSTAGASFYSIESGEIYGNLFKGALTYRINFLGDVIFENNYFAGGIDTQASATATFSKNTFASGVTPIAPINRTTGIGTAAGRNVGDTVNADIPSNSVIRKSFALRYVDRRTLTNFDYNTLTAGEYVLHQVSTGQVNAPPNSYASLYVMRNYLDDNQLTVVGHDYFNGGLITRGKNNGNWSAWAKHYHTLNTTVDANGFIKAASPIVRMFAYGIEVNEEAALQDISFEKLGVGDYLLKGSTGFAQEGWYVETPKDANGNVLFSVVYTTLENGDISVKTYKKKFDLETASIVADLDNPVDITESRWIDLRLREVQEVLDMPTEPEEVDQIEPTEAQP